MSRVEVDSWYRAALLGLSLLCGALISLWVNSLSGWGTTPAAAPAAGPRPAEVIGVDVDARHMEFVRAAI
jgi:hypothetical protein